MHEPSPSGPRPGFTQTVGRNGYQWWYIDALSDDGRHGLTVIVFIGSVFSPYYAAARRRGPAPAEQHCAVNAVLYEPGGRKVWAMTERGENNLRRSETELQIGPSGIHWEGKQVSVQVDEVTVPLPRRLRGEIRLELPAVSEQDYVLDPNARHRWWPVSPSCRVSVAMQSPALHWEGEGYFDSNRGREALESGFREWDWSRTALPGGECLVQYHALSRDPDAPARDLALHFDAQGRAIEHPLLPRRGLPTTGIWRIPRATGGADDDEITVVRTLEDTPFYARSLLSTESQGQRLTTFHESLSLERFKRRWVQTLLPFRMPRNTASVRGGPG
jgi:carotenoid 1,2-hydratase